MKLALRFLLICNYLNLLGYALFSPLYALFAARVGANPFQTGAAWALYAALQGCLIIIMGRLEDRVRNQARMVVIGYFWLACASLLFLTVKSPVSLFAVLAVNALGAGILFPAWKSIFSKNETLGKEASQWSLFDGGNMLCTAAAALTGGLLVRDYGFDAVFVGMFALQIVAAATSMKLLGVKSTRRRRWT